ncbi:MAG: 16S rRNA (adenine(1518)-N(6)/adenine(1519)-N(6))-dimethyltransferase, partial [Alphaproteobacteria bacterium]|nr:16S rRNA (adenine(1518)-N(6)/adenine(1519)-N(6))-dimethyltransferase [Alphaproteobacteria bacterium]
IAQYISIPQMLFDLPPSVFTPPPKVTSTLVGFTKRDNAGMPLCDIADLEKATAAGFAGRRKMLRQSLKPLGLDLAALGITDTLRAQNLDVNQWAVIASAISEKRKEK